MTFLTYYYTLASHWIITERLPTTSIPRLAYLWIRAASPLAQSQPTTCLSIKAACLVITFHVFRQCCQNRGHRDQGGKVGAHGAGAMCYVTGEATGTAMHMVRATHCLLRRNKPRAVSRMSHRKQKVNSTNQLSPHQEHTTLQLPKFKHTSGMGQHPHSPVSLRQQVVLSGQAVLSSHFTSPFEEILLRIAGIFSSQGILSPLFTQPPSVAHW